MLCRALENEFKKIQHRSSMLQSLESSAAEEPSYIEKVRFPIDLRMIGQRLKMGDYYRTRDLMRADLLRIVNNFKLCFKKQQEQNQNDYNNYSMLTSASNEQQQHHYCTPNLTMQTYNCECSSKNKIYDRKLSSFMNKDNNNNSEY